MFIFLMCLTGSEWVFRAAQSGVEFIADNISQIIVTASAGWFRNICKIPVKLAFKGQEHFSNFEPWPEKGKHIS